MRQAQRKESYGFFFGTTLEASHVLAWDYLHEEIGFSPLGFMISVYSRILSPLILTAHPHSPVSFCRWPVGERGRTYIYFLCFPFYFIYVEKKYILRYRMSFTGYLFGKPICFHFLGLGFWLSILLHMRDSQQAGKNPSTYILFTSFHY